MQYTSNTTQYSVASQSFYLRAKIYKKTKNFQIFSIIVFLRYYDFVN